MKQSDEMTKKTNEEEARNREGRSEQEGVSFTLNNLIFFH